PGARAIAQKTLAFYKGVVDRFAEEIAFFGNAPTLYAGLADGEGVLQWYEGLLRFTDAEGKFLGSGICARDYSRFIAEAAMRDSYLKAPYYKPHGYPDGVYRVGPLARLNVARHCGTPLADAELVEFRQRFGPVVHSSFHYHYARLIEALHALEKMEQLVQD